MKKKYIILAFVVFVILIFFFSKDSVNTGENVVDFPNSTLYTSAKYGFSIKYPSDYRLDENYSYNLLGEGKELPGVAFFVPKTLTDGTNLSEETHIGVEALKNGMTCEAKSFFGDVVDSQKTEIINGKTFSVATASGAGAGNFYEEIVSVENSKTPCIGLRLFIHSTNIGNYDPGTRKEFDKNALLDVYQKMRESLSLQ